MWYRISTPRITFGVKVNDHGIIVDAAPIVQKWIGSPFSSFRQVWRSADVQRNDSHPAKARQAS